MWGVTNGVKKGAVIHRGLRRSRIEGGADKGCSNVWLLRGKAPGANNEVCPWTTLFTNNINFTKEITYVRKSLSHTKAAAIHVFLLCLGAGSIKTFNLLSSITAYRDGNLGLGWRGVINYEARGNVVNCCKIATLAVRYSE